MSEFIETIEYKPKTQKYSEPNVKIYSNQSFRIQSQIVPKVLLH